ncbi:MAG: hypothetical protein ACTSUG_12970 [Candidatus Helarchaeota archaeon]
MIIDSKAIEFGYELIQAIPWAYWLHQRGELEKTISCIDTSPLYYFSPIHEEKYPKRNETVSLINNYFPIKNIHVHNLDKSKWTPPPYKEIYQNDQFKWNKPTLVIANKYTIEWNEPPKNFYSIKMIKALLKYLTPNYQVIYNRAEHKTEESIVYNLKEKNIIRNEFSDVILFEDLLKNNSIGYNLLQLKVFSNCDYFITIQGGSSIISSFFAKYNFIYAIAGNEIKVNSYNNWYHEFSGSKIYHHNNYKSLLRDIKKYL